MRKPGWLKYEKLVKDVIARGEYEDKTGAITDLPDPNNVRDILEHHFKIHSNRNFRIILVEDYGGYKVFIQIPGEKTDYDFFVWQAIFREGKLVDVKVPAHNDLAAFYASLKTRHEDLNEYLINAVIRLIRDRWGVQRIISKYFNNLNEELRNEAEKFLSTLKWIALQEDVNFPPKEGKLGSKYALAVYALLEANFAVSEIWRIIRFKPGK